MSCPDLGQPDNGMIECMFGDDGVASYQDTCRFSCVEGYLLSGSTSRTCQSEGTWSGGGTTCHRGKMILLLMNIKQNHTTIHYCLVSYANYIAFCDGSSELQLKGPLFRINTHNSVSCSPRSRRVTPWVY